MWKKPKFRKQALRFPFSCLYLKKKLVQSKIASQRKFEQLLNPLDKQVFGPTHISRKIELGLSLMS